jgi:hypothetical protein
LRRSTINKLTAKYGEHDWGAALESLKRFEGVRNFEHGPITEDAEVLNDAGEVIGNLLDHIY